MGRGLVFSAKIVFTTVTVTISELKLFTRGTVLICILPREARQPRAKMNRSGSALSLLLES
jgi:hypothetical protein